MGEYRFKVNQNGAGALLLGDKLISYDPNIVIKSDVDLAKAFPHKFERAIVRDKQLQAPAAIPLLVKSKPGVAVSPEDGAAPNAAPSDIVVSDETANTEVSDDDVTGEFPRAAELELTVTKDKENGYIVKHAGSSDIVKAGLKTSRAVTQFLNGLVTKPE